MGCSSVSVLLVNAEIDSMGGVVEGGVDVACKASPQRAAIEKVQAELRQEYSVRDKRKRELEFLEKGGNPLDLLKPGNAAAVSVQSTSFTSHHPDQFITSEAKGSFAFTASPHGDSVESSGRLGANPCEPNSADNLMLFDAEPEFSGGDKGSLHPTTNKIMPSEKLFQLDGIHGTRDNRDSAAFSLPRKAYRRRNRSRPNREGTRSSSTDVNHTRGSHGSSLPSRHGKDLKSLISDNQSTPINCISEPTCPTDGTLHKTGLAGNQQDMELDGGKAVESTKNLHEGVEVEAGSDAIASDTLLAGQCIQQSDSVAVKTPMEMSSDKIKAKLASEEMTAAEPSINEYQPPGPANNVENQSTSCQINGVSSKKEGIKHDAYKTNALHGMKGLDSESSFNQTRINIFESNAGEMSMKIRHADSNGKIDDQTLVTDGMPLVEGDEFVEQKRETGVVESCTLSNSKNTSVYQSQQESGCKLQPEDELNRSGSAMKDVVIGQFVTERTEACKPSGFESGKKPDHTLDDNLGPNNENQDLIDTSISNFPEDGSLTRMSTVSFKAQKSSCCPKLVEIDDDSILKEAQIIEAKRKRIAELCVATYPKQLRPKSHWDCVLEEMAWLANDFAQERIWKMAAAAQISFRAASSGCLRQQESSSKAQAKKIAHSLAKSVMGFWHSVKETSRILEEDSPRDDTSSVKAYAMRFLKHNTSTVILSKAEVSSISDVSDVGILDLSWEDKLTEENLFYTVPPGAIEAYRISIESHVAQCERIGSIVQEEVETSACDAVADFESQDTAYDEDEGETNTYNMSMAFEGGRSTGYVQKKPKHLIHAYGVTSCEVNSDTLQMPYVENKAVTQQSALLAKRPGGSFNVSIPTKRVRTASRRIISPFSAGTSGCIQVPNKTDASSGDTNSFQDDQTTLRGGSFAPHCLEVESAGAFDKQLSFDSAEGVTKHKKKKKKAKHLNAAYEPRWQAGSTFQMEQYQRDNLKRSHQFDSNGGSGLFGQPVTKKPKIMRQSQDNFFENIAAIGGSAPSPVASQMSNMSNPNKFIKLLGGRDRGRKPKVLKMPGGQSGSGSPWTLFEDQALVVLAHDLGPNWELVSDAINSTLQFKCIFRKAKECKERHNFLMDRTSGDGADSAEDSGSSQPYPSTLPGIPKGSARQLFQRLQGPMEEETLKSHFEKIIIIGQKLQYRKTQNDKQDPKQLQQPHSSHTVALSQVSPNNLNGGPVLTPLDLSDSTIAGPEILPLGYQGQHPGGISNPNQSTVTQMHPASGASSALQGSPNNLLVGNNLSSSPGSLNPSMRDVRYGVPRSASLLADEQQRMQQYNQMITSRNTTQANISSSGALPGSDRGVRVLPGGSGMGLACGVNRSIPLAKPGFQGLASSSIVNPGGMVPPGMSSANMHSGVGSGQGSSMLRPREATHIMRPGLSQDPQRQMMVPDIQMQVSPGNGQVPHFGGLNSPLPNQTASPPVSSYPLHHQPSHPISPHPISPHHTHFQGTPNHAPNPQHQAYAMRLAKERQQHRFQGQQPQFAASMPHVQSQPQLPISSPSQNSPQVQPQAGSPPVTISPLTSVSSMNSMSQNQQKHQSQTQGVVRNAQAAGAGITNHTSKQRQRQQQQLSQGSRQHPQQRQQPQAQQPAKIVKGIGRGNLITHQNPSLVNGVSASPGNQGSEKGETATHLNPSQGLYTSPSVNTLPPTRQYVSPHSSNHSLPQQKNYSAQAASSTKHLNQITSHSDSSQGHVPAVAPGLSTGHQSVSSMAKPGQNIKKAPSHQKLANQNQLAHQRVQQNRQINCDPSNKLQARDSDADQHPTNSSAEMVVTTISPQPSNHVGNVAQVVSSTSTHQWHASEPIVDQNAVSSAVNLSASESMPSNSGESASQVGPVPDHRPSSSSIPSSSNDVSAQWQQQQPSQLQHANSPVPQHQQHQQALHSQQQEQLLQAGKGNLYGRPSDQKLE